jgi:hypothetical protein
MTRTPDSGSEDLDPNTDLDTTTEASEVSA